MREGVFDRLFALFDGDIAVGNFAVALLDLGDDGDGVFIARVIGREDGKICKARRDLPHDGALALVAVAPAAEEQDEPSPALLFEGGDRFFEAVGRVREVDEDIRPVIGRHPFEPPVHLLR